jgi:hypothetical protein
VSADEFYALVENEATWGNTTSMTPAGELQPGDTFRLPTKGLRAVVASIGQGTASTSPDWLRINYHDAAGSMTPKTQEITLIAALVAAVALSMLTPSCTDDGPEPAPTTCAASDHACHERTGTSPVDGCTPTDHVCHEGTTP